MSGAKGQNWRKMWLLIILGLFAKKKYISSPFALIGGFLSLSSTNLTFIQIKTLKMMKLSEQFLAWGL